MKENIDYEDIYVHYDAEENMKILIKRKQAFYGLDNELFAYEDKEPIEGLVRCRYNNSGDKKATMLYRLVGNGIDLSEKYANKRIILSVPKINLSSKEMMSFNYIKLMIVANRLFGKNNFSMKQSMMKIKKLSNLPDKASIEDLQDFENNYNEFKLKTHSNCILQKNKEECLTKQ